MREFPFEEELLACYWISIKTISVTEGPKTNLKPEISMMSEVNLEKHSNGKDDVQKSSRIKWI